MISVVVVVATATAAAASYYKLLHSYTDKYIKFFTMRKLKAFGINEWKSLSKGQIDKKIIQTVIAFSTKV